MAVSAWNSNNNNNDDNRKHQDKKKPSSPVLFVARNNNPDQEKINNTDLDNCIDSSNPGEFVGADGLGDSFYSNSCNNITVNNNDAITYTTFPTTFPNTSTDYSMDSVSLTVTESIRRAGVLGGVIVEPRETQQQQQATNSLETKSALENDVVNDYQNHYDIKTSVTLMPPTTTPISTWTDIANFEHNQIQPQPHDNTEDNNKTNIISNITITPPATLYTTSSILSPHTATNLTNDNTINVNRITNNTNTNIENNVVENSLNNNYDGCDNDNNTNSSIINDIDNAILSTMFPIESSLTQKEALSSSSFHELLQSVSTDSSNICCNSLPETTENTTKVATKVATTPTTPTTCSNSNSIDNAQRASSLSFVTTSTTDWLYTMTTIPANTTTNTTTTSGPRCCESIPLTSVVTMNSSNTPFLVLSPHYNSSRKEPMSTDTNNYTIPTPVATTTNTDDTLDDTLGMTNTNQSSNSNNEDVWLSTSHLEGHFNNNSNDIGYYHHQAKQHHYHRQQEQEQKQELNQDSSHNLHEQIQTQNNNENAQLVVVVVVEDAPTKGTDTSSALVSNNINDNKDTNCQTETTNTTTLRTTTNINTFSKIQHNDSTSGDENSPISNSISNSTIVTENALLRQQLAEYQHKILELQETIHYLEHENRQMRKLPTGKISQIPIEDMIQLMEQYGSEVSDNVNRHKLLLSTSPSLSSTVSAPYSVWKRKMSIQRASLVRQFRRWNPNFLQYFEHIDGKWVPKLGYEGEMKRRVLSRQQHAQALAAAALETASSAAALESSSLAASGEASAGNVAGSKKASFSSSSSPAVVAAAGSAIKVAPYGRKQKAGKANKTPPPPPIAIPNSKGKVAISPKTTEDTKITTSATTNTDNIIKSNRNKKTSTFRITRKSSTPNMRSKKTIDENMTHPQPTCSNTSNNQEQHGTIEGMKLAARNTVEESNAQNNITMSNNNSNNQTNSNVCVDELQMSKSPRNHVEV